MLSRGYYVLKEGDKIPADARIIELNDLKIDESALTGESEPVHKNINIIEAENIPAPDQKTWYSEEHMLSEEMRVL